MNNTLAICTIIFIVFILNIILYFLAYKKAKEAKKSFFTKRSHTDILIKKHSKPNLEKFDLDKTNILISSSEKYFNLFLSISSTFTLLGILGTVYGLIKLTPEELITSFQTALYTTLTGIVCAIICKFLEGLLYPIIENNQKEQNNFYQYYLNNYEYKEVEQYEK